jgi:hypothetical protein
MSKKGDRCNGNPVVPAMNTEKSKVLALHRYYLAALLLKKEFDSAMLAATKKELADPNCYQALPFGIYLGFWYSSLYVVVEGLQA